MTKPHGVRGQVVVELVTNREERVAPGATLHGPGGPLVVAAAYPSQAGRRAGQPHGGRWVVTFDQVGSREQAEALRGATLAADPLPAEDGTLWAHEVVGAELADLDGQLVGRVVALQANPASDLLVLDNGALVPLRFVVSAEPGRLRAELPAGLLEL